MKKAHHSSLMHWAWDSNTQIQSYALMLKLSNTFQDSHLLLIVRKQTSALVKYLYINSRYNLQLVSFYHFPKVKIFTKNKGMHVLTTSLFSQLCRETRPPYPPRKVMKAVSQSKAMHLKLLLLTSQSTWSSIEGHRKL